VAAAVADHLSRKGLRVFILTRGYGRADASAPVVLHPAKGLFPGLDQTGDEARVLSALAPKAGVVIDADRVRGGRLAIERFGAQALVLDDGFQRRFGLARDLDLLCATASDPGAGGALLPLGRLREPLSQARKASALVLTRALGEPLAALPADLAGLPRIDASLRPTGLRAWPGPGRKPLGWLKRRRVAALSGLASPQRFENSLSGLGATLVQRLRLADHAAPGPGRLKALALAAQDQGAQALVCTLKDAVKLEAAECRSLAVPLYVLEAGIGFAPARALDRLLAPFLR